MAIVDKTDMRRLKLSQEWLQISSSRPFRLSGTGPWFEVSNTSALVLVSLCNLWISEQLDTP